MTPTPPIPPGPEQEEARRQAESQAPPLLEGAAQAAPNALLDGAIEVAVDAAAATAEGVVTVVKVSAEVVGGILTGLGDL